MGLIKAAVGAIGGSLADQWKDFYTVPGNIQNTAAVFPAVKVGQDEGRGSNTKSSDMVITNGSKFVVPEGHALITLQDGAVTSLVAEPGAYIWDYENPESQSIFSGNSLRKSLITQSWERFKFGGRPTGQQLALFVNLQELPNNKFGTQSEIYWDDDFLNTQVGAITRGTYTLKIIDPILFVKSFVPSAITQNGETFDFTDGNNPQANQLFSEVISVLAATFSSYVNQPGKENRISRIQQDSIGFANALSEQIENSYQWIQTRGLEIAKVALVAVEYDEATRELLKTVQRADALAGQRGNSNLQASVAQGIQAAGATEGAAGILGLGIAAGSIGLTDLQQPNVQKTAPNDQQPAEGRSSQDGLVQKLRELQSALEQSLISQDEYDKARASLLNG
jgi:membrane protease subunit (stomatin/prohibitin family)